MVMKTNFPILICSSVFLAFTCCDNGGPIETGSCTDGLQNQDETGIDCGGSKCVECFDCFSNYCEILSGSTPPGIETSKKWKCTELDGKSTEDLDCAGDVGCEIYLAIRLKFMSKGGAEFTGTEGGPDKGRWSFDDPDNPDNITILINDPESEYYPQEVFHLVSIEADQFVTDRFGKTAKFEPY